MMNDPADVQIFSSINSSRFFSPASGTIAAITGTATEVRVTMDFGIVLVYSGTGLTFDGTTPTGGNVDVVTVFNRTTGAVAGILSFDQAPISFADITTTRPYLGYLDTPHVIQDAIGNSVASLAGGKKADHFYWRGGADFMNGLAGSDTFVVDARTLNTNRIAGATLFGSSGFDTLLLTTADQSGDTKVIDLTGVFFRSIEKITLNGGITQISALEIGDGRLASDAVIDLALTQQELSNGIQRIGELRIVQAVGTAVDLSGFRVESSTLADLYDSRIILSVLGTAEDDVQTGTDTISGAAGEFLGQDLLNGAAGNDSLYGLGGNDNLDGGDGDDILSLGTASGPTIEETVDQQAFGGRGDDLIIGDTGNMEQEYLGGGDGNDTILSAGARLSFIEAGAGDDNILAGGDFDNIYGGAGNDTFASGPGDTFLSGDGGDDRYVIGSTTAGILEDAADNGYDRVITSVDLDLSDGQSDIYGDDYTDSGYVERIDLAGSAGLMVTGTRTGNLMNGTTGADTLGGAAGNDSLYGWNGTDVLTGGTGTDVLTGGDAADIFVFATAFGRDTARDFTDGTDIIDLTGLTAVTSFADLLADHARQVGTAVRIIGDGSDVLILQNTALSQITPDDVLIS